MIFETSASRPLDGVVVVNYFRNLVNNFFKILPMRENSEPSLGKYMCNLRDELLGCKSLIVVLNGDPMYLSLISLLQYLIDTPEASVPYVRRRVFDAITMCNELADRYSEKTKAGGEA